MKILLTGHTGQLGHVLAQDLQAHGEVVVASRAAMDLSQPDRIRSFVRAVRPDLIVNPAAYTAVDRAQSEVPLAAAVNSVAPMVLAQEAHALDAGFIHFSTDYVFDGGKASPYTELDPPCPANAYGQTKLDGEQAIAEQHDAWWIFRLSWVYGAYGGNFLKTIARLARERQALTVVADQIGAPTWTRTISRAVQQCLLQRPQGVSLAAYMRSTAGIYHLAAAGATSWHGYAQHIVRRLAAQGVALTLDADAIAPVTTAEYPTAARRPANSRMDTSRVKKTFGLDFPSWDEEVDHCLAELANIEQTGQSGA
ncbi:dTDP-4-dehydrorhamnose reductase [Herbaspirillum sp.]|uniref:dTDP-4-dehydrorhamnose reductase n=1 Tax=Herbaspirillum sp. TaxID=1890675 RepID=UPI001B14B7F4|nr:dTDP-4-dehydrorhamnose reductase [Herbaspirillum sp.]MBO9536364.1 dTDP-4-dehydrorhamnose reductase [Herbaspirillum sp.]